MFLRETFVKWFVLKTVQWHWIQKVSITFWLEKYNEICFMNLPSFIFIDAGNGQFLPKKIIHSENCRKNYSCKRSHREKNGASTFYYPGHFYVALAFANQKEIYAPENCSSPLVPPPSPPVKRIYKWSIPYFVNNLPQFVVFSCNFFVCVMYKASPPWLQTWFPTSINIYISRRGNSQPYSP